MNKFFSRSWWFLCGASVGGALALSGGYCIPIPGEEARYVIVAFIAAIVFFVALWFEQNGED